jgi:CheY-like chemotaxis protein
MAYNYPLNPNLRNLSARLARVEVLLADADPKLSEVVRDVLRYIGLQRITSVNNGVEALEYIRKREVDLLITDWDMPQMNGAELVSFLRANPQSPNPYMPIIMLTGKAERRDVENARDVGVTEFLVKPFSAKTLYERLVMVIENPRSFIIADGYKGPDRRRRTDIPPGADERRIQTPLQKYDLS